MKVVCIIYSNHPETVWNAFRFANGFLVHDHQVSIFLLGQGVEAATISTLQFDVQAQIDVFRENGGFLLGCGLCCENRSDEMPFLKEQLGCEMGSMQQLNTLVIEADKILTF
jgi:sulfur relay (sulfurtransferase) complex TusBCD TusD component (DsrE family)